MSFRHHHFIYLPYLAVSLSAQSLEPLVVTGKSESLIGEASSASKGQASAEPQVNCVFSISADGQPMNFVTHAHGQGYADLNPIIPELIESIDYWKGPFYGQLGNLSTAGAAKFRYFDLLPQGIASITLGEHNFYRGLVADTLDLSNPASASSKSNQLQAASADRSACR